MFDIGFYYIGWAMKYFVGEMLLCNKDLYMGTGNIAFNKGCCYRVVSITDDVLFLKSNIGNEHGVRYDDWLKNFSAPKAFDRKLKFR